MGLLKGGAIFGLGAAVGIFVARARDRQDFRKRALNNCPLKKAKEMEKAKELEKAKNPDSGNTQLPANVTLEQPNYQ